MAFQNTDDDPRLGFLLQRKTVDNPLAKIGIIGFPCDDGVARNNGRVGARNGPASFRKYLQRLGTAYNPEYGIDLGRLVIEDLGDANLGESLEKTHENLTKKVEEALANNFIPIVIGGGNDQSYPNARAYMNKLGGGHLGVINIDAHLDVRPLKGDPPTSAHSGSPFRQLLEDEDFRRNGGVFVEFAAQGHQCSKSHVDYLREKGAAIRWLSDLRQKGDVVKEFINVLTDFGSDRSIFVSFDIDSIKSSDCPGVSCPGSVGLTAEEALGVCRAAGRNDKVGLIDFSEYNPDIEEDRTGRLLVNMVYHFMLASTNLYAMEKSFSVTPVALDCHPTSDVIAIGFIDGAISTQSIRLMEMTLSRKNIFDQSNQTVSRTQLKLTESWQRAHKRAVRRVKFAPESGSYVISLTKNRALCQWDTETGKRLRCIRESHEARPIALHCASDHICATGDEDGRVKLWDWRSSASPPCVMTFDENADIVNDLTSSEDGRMLLAASGDGTLTAFNIKKRALDTQSEEMHAELLSVTIARNGQKVVCGSGEGGYLELFNWDSYGNITARVQTGHRDSVDRLITIDETGLIASASADGTIRLLKIGPNSSLGVIGEHREADSREPTAIEDLAITKDRRYLISCGQDDAVRVWNLEEFLRERENEDGEEQQQPSAAKKSKKSTKNGGGSGKKKLDTDFFEGLLDLETANGKNGDHADKEEKEEEEDGDSDSSMDS